MVISLSLSSLTVVAATAVEANAVRRAAPGARVIETGVGLTKLTQRSGANLFAPKDALTSGLGDMVISCGLAGALRDDLPTGTVLVPETVTTPSGETIVCDPQLANALALAARRLGYEPICGPLLTSDVLVTGSQRALWAKRGYVAVDMETGLIQSRRLAAVRVVLDTPDREISAAWLEPLRALRRPQLWPEALWLTREAPRCARIAAAVLAAAFPA